MTWIVIENYRLDLLPSDVGNVIAFHDGLYFTYQSLFGIMIQKTNVFHMDVQYGPLKDLISFDYLLQFYQELLALHSVYADMTNRFDDLMMLKISVRGVLMNMFMRVSVNGEEVFQYYSYLNNLKKLERCMAPYRRQTTCPVVQCEPGHEYVFKKLDLNASQWNESFQWTCQRCAPGFYKAVHGNSSCKSCPMLYLAREARDSCFDPYVTRVISLEQPFTLIAVGLTCFGTLSCLIVLLAFFKYRNTPMMKAANVNMSLFHLCLMIGNFTLLFLAYYGKASRVKCYCRLFAMTIFYTIIVGVILLRSQKVLKAFGSRVKMTKSEVRRQFVGEIFFVVVLALIDNLILFIVASITPIKVTTLLNGKTFERTPYCNTWEHLNVLVAFTICLHFVCFVQAFRGRRLPGAFKETMSIVYGNFISILVFGTMYPIVLFQRDVLMRDGVFWIALTLNTNLLAVFCYFKRVYVAVFEPEKNTIEYSRSVIMAKMSKESRNRIK